MAAQLTASQQLTLPIRGMTCLGCVASLQLALDDLPGVQEVVVDLAAKQVRVAYNPALVGATQMAEAVVEAGYAVDEATLPETTPPPLPAQLVRPWRRPDFFGLLGKGK